MKGRRTLSKPRHRLLHQGELEEGNELMQIGEQDGRRNISILGTVYTIKEQSESENKLLKECDGYCDWTTKEIVVEREMQGTLGDMERYIRKVIRHEIIHAFLFESGLAEASIETGAWAKNEEMIDWFARQGENICKAWKDAGALEVND